MWLGSLVRPSVEIAAQAPQKGGVAGRRGASWDRGTIIIDHCIAACDNDCDSPVRTTKARVPVDVRGSEEGRRIRIPFIAFISSIPSIPGSRVGEEGVGSTGKN